MKLILRGTLLALCLSTSPMALAQTLKFATPGDIGSYDPNAQLDAFTLNMLQMTYDTLVRRDRDLGLAPGLATSWEAVAPDRWRFTLRQGVTFHEGQTFTADDVVATINRTLDPSARNRGHISAVIGVEKVDDYTVDILLEGAYPLLPNDLTGISILSGDWLREHDALVPGNTTEGRASFASTHANGTGPFILESYQPGAKSTFTVNESWWSEPEHNLKRVEFYPIASDATRIAALLSGEIDMTNSVPLQDVSRVAATPGFTVVEEPGYRVIFLGFNWQDSLHAMPGEPNPFNDIKVRQALSHAIDMDAIRERIMRGKSRNIGTLIAPGQVGYVEALDVPVEYDVELAKSLLAEAGYPDGFTTGLSCTNDRYIADEQICIAIASMWSQIGVKTELTTESASTFFPRHDRGETDVFLIGSAGLPSMDGFNVLSGYFTSRQEGYGGVNPNGFKVDEIDALVHSAATELDEPARQQMLHDAFEILRDNTYFIPLHQQPITWAMREGASMPQFADEYVRPWYTTIDSK